MHDYTPGMFHPSLNAGQWYSIHPATGIHEFNKNNSVDGMLSENEAWQMVDEQNRDEIEDTFTVKIIEWFISRHENEVLIYFSGGYEKHEETMLKRYGLSTKYTGKWQKKFSDIITAVNVHELALVADEELLVCYESWSNLFIKVSSVDKIPTKFSIPYGTMK
jgi:hypothetical protein